MRPGGRLQSTRRRGKDGSHDQPTGSLATHRGRRAVPAGSSAGGGRGRRPGHRRSRGGMLLLGRERPDRRPATPEPSTTGTCSAAATASGCSRCCDAYREANPDIDLEAVTLAWGNPYYTKLSLATARRPAAGRGDLPPDPDEDPGRGRPARRSSTPEDLARHGMTPDKFNQRAWEAGLVDGKAYAIPLDTHPFVMFYNTDICEKAGLLDSDGKLDAARRPGRRSPTRCGKAKEVTGAVRRRDRRSTPTPRRRGGCSSRSTRQLGGEMLADDGTRVVIDDAKAIAGARRSCER